MTIDVAEIDVAETIAREAMAQCRVGQGSGQAEIRVRKSAPLQDARD